MACTENVLQPHVHVLLASQTALYCLASETSVHALRDTSRNSTYRNNLIPV